MSVSLIVDVAQHVVAVVGPRVGDAMPQSTTIMIIVLTTRLQPLMQHLHDSRRVSSTILLHHTNNHDLEHEPQLYMWQRMEALTYKIGPSSLCP